MVGIAVHRTEGVGRGQDGRGAQSRSAMHAPDGDMPHPNFVPVSPRSSRRANWRVTPSTSGRVYSVPLTESFALVMGSDSFEVFASVTKLGPDNSEAPSPDVGD